MSAQTCGGSLSRSRFLNLVGKWSLTWCVSGLTVAASLWTSRVSRAQMTLNYICSALAVPSCKTCPTTPTPSSTGCVKLNGWKWGTCQQKTSSKCTANTAKCIALQNCATSAILGSCTITGRFPVCT